ncbi:MAG: putative baseplate assembly protein [Actinobacteria bacterium]|nr:putative baseplate assembly protein [Actinomycetota bacterium]
MRRMQEQISLKTLKEGPHSDSRPLAALGTREPDDPSIALLDSAAMMLDVLTFYQERIANEGFLGTATERLSVLEMARAIGYELSPGVATDVILVFTLDETPGKAPSRSKIATRTRVQSLPADGDLPQTFETVDDFVAYKVWNKLKPRQVFEQRLSVDSSGSLKRKAFAGSPQTTQEIEFAGTSLMIKPGDLLVAHVGEGATKGTTISRVVTVEEGADRDVTTVTIEKPSNIASDGSSSGGGGSSTSTITAPADMTDVNLAKVLAAERSESDLQILLEELDWDVDEFLEAVNPDLDDEDTAEPHATNGVFVLRRRVGMFGHNAQPYESLPITQREGEWAKVADSEETDGYEWAWVDPVYPNDWEGNDVWEKSQGDAYSDADLFLEREVDEVLDEGWIVLDGKTGSSRLIRAYRIQDKTPASLADYGISGKVSGLDLKNADGTPPTTFGFRLRKTTAHVASEWLELADLEIPDPVEDSTIELDRMVLGLAKGQDVVVTGELTDPEGVTGTEVATIEEITHQHGRTTLTFVEDLTNTYIRDSVTIYGNVVRATHGETMEQPLGSGDGSIANQTFDLGTSPLTYIAASTPSGSESTLELRVNGRLWDEVRSLYDKGPAEQVFTVRIADDQEATVTLGDGRAGARPATGTENITARYRTGIGPAGEVDAETIQLLMTRPPGVKTVNNPLPAAGAEAPETFATARKNAPMTVRTLDRVVSLTDFEDFAATFAGIGKARADVLRLHGQRLVHITVGSSTGGKVKDDKIKLLVTAIDKARDPGEAVCVSTYRPLSFDVYGAVKTDKKLVHETVMRDVRKALLDAFSFEARRFAQAASVSEIMEVIHTVTGVIAADIDKLEVKGGPATTIVVPPLGVMVSRPARLETGATSLGCSDIDPADLLLINRNGINLEKMA